MSKKDAKVKKESKHKKMSAKEYETELYKLHTELVKLQDWVQETGHKVIVVFEGRDAAGKGGVIKRITERVSPRVFRVAALPSPSDQEKTHIYGQRYIQHFPAAGEVVLFDRSWYNRAGVERVMKFCTEEEYRRFLDHTPVFEQFIVDAGIQLIKYWFDVSIEEQERRFQARVEDPRKTWKLSPMDVESFKRWYDYSRARDEMLKATSSKHAPWYVVKANSKKHARLNCISHLLSQIPYKELKREKVVLGKRDFKEKYDDRVETVHAKFVPEKF
jgi:polyphosphate kinase 2